jgi:eight-cysteine-cluster-containing protein
MRWLLPLLLVLAPACGDDPGSVAAGTDVTLEPPAEPAVNAPVAAEPETPKEPETPADPAVEPPEGPATPPATAEPPVAAPAPSAPPLEPPATGTPTPGALYEQCRDRVEQPEANGECDSDDDCASSGCGREVCTTATAAADLMTTCEVRQCFSVLDSCGCDKGRCTWSLKDAVPPRKTIRRLDVQ